MEEDGLSTFKPRSRVRVKSASPSMSMSISLVAVFISAFDGRRHRPDLQQIRRCRDGCNPGLDVRFADTLNTDAVGASAHIAGLPGGRTGRRASSTDLLIARLRQSADLVPGQPFHCVSSSSLVPRRCRPGCSPYRLEFLPQEDIGRISVTDARARTSPSMPWVSCRTVAERTPKSPYVSRMSPRRSAVAAVAVPLNQGSLFVELKPKSQRRNDRGDGEPAASSATSPASTPICMQCREPAARRSLRQRHQLVVQG